MTRDELVRAAEASISRGSKSFRTASRLFDRRTRERAWLLYCWCRHCDDQCDGQILGMKRTEAGSVEELERLTSRVLRGERTGELPFDALGQLLAECRIPHGFILDHLRGFRLDAEGWRPETEEDLLQYCYHVAGAVGCMMAVVMGVPPQDEETLLSASDLGIAFQLVNIARDIRDDHLAGRCYLPREWMEQAGLDQSNPFRVQEREKLVAIVRRVCELAVRYERSARVGIPALPFRSRWAIHAAAGIYGGIGRRVAALGDAAWDQRVSVPRRRKAAIMMRALGSAI